MKNKKELSAKELRIGNLVYNSHGDIHAIGCNCFHRFRYPSMDGNPSGFKPIPLTEEILLKCGFNVYDPKYKYFTHKDIPGILQLFDGVAEYSIDSNDVCWVNGLHQLQNLYHTLTGQELKIEL